MIRVKRINIRTDTELPSMEALNSLKEKIEAAIADDEAEVYFNFENTAVKFNPVLGSGPRSFEK